MKLFLIVFSDPKGVLNSQEVELHATSFPDAYVKSCSYKELFLGLELTLIKQLEF